MIGITLIYEEGGGNGSFVNGCRKSRKGEIMENRDDTLKEIAAAIDRLAKVYDHTRKWSKWAQHISDISRAVEHMHDVHGDGLFDHLSERAIKQFYPDRAPKSDGYRYPWGLLKKAGDSFLWPHTTHRKSQVARASITTSANQKFGKGMVRTQFVPSGILVTLKHDLGCGPG
jgi:hypothetical protein